MSGRRFRVEARSWPGARPLADVDLVPDRSVNRRGEGEPALGSGQTRSRTQTAHGRARRDAECGDYERRDPAVRVDC